MPKFSPVRFGKAFIATKARRVLGEFFDALPEDTLVFIVINDRLLTDKIPDELRYHYKAQLLPYRDIFQHLTNDEVYNWLPPKYQTLFESLPNGKAWANRQIDVIRDFLCS